MSQRKKGDARKMLNPITRASDWPNWRQSAEIFAVLASVKDLSELEQWQKEKLVSDLQKVDTFGDLLFHLADLPEDAPSTRFSRALGRRLIEERSARLKRASKNKRFASSWQGSNAPYQWLALWNVHHTAYPSINQLVDHHMLDVREIRTKAFRPVRVEQSEGGTQITYDPLELALDGLWDLFWKIITLHPFPFRRCQFCKRVFIRSVKKQKFCEKSCANKAIGPRTEYMQKYMAEKRAEERKHKSI
jgi:hypothetical protein